MSSGIHKVAKAVSWEVQEDNISQQNASTECEHHEARGVSWVSNPTICYPLSLRKTFNHLRPFTVVDLRWTISKYRSADYLMSSGAQKRSPSRISIMDPNGASFAEQAKLNALVLNAGKDSFLLIISGSTPVVSTNLVAPSCPKRSTLCITGMKIQQFVILG